MEHGRIHRLLRLITVLQSGQGHGVRQLTLELNISRRTLFRDLRLLQSAGIPVFHHPQSGYQLARNFFLPAINLTVPETLGLLLLSKTAAAQTKRPFVGPALSAISKLLITVPDPIRRACSDLLSNVTIDPGAQCVSEAEVQLYPELQRCVDERRRCRLRYKSPVDAQPFVTQFDPYALHFAGRAWYVLGYSSLHEEVRMLKLARILELETLTAIFQRPRRFRVADKLGKAWHLNPEGAVHHIELEFTPKVATNVAEVHWHPTQKHEFLPDGRCRMSFDVDGLHEIAWWVCGYADQVCVLKPTALRKIVRDMLHHAAGQYEKVGKSPDNAE